MNESAAQYPKTTFNPQTLRRALPAARQVVVPLTSIGETKDDVTRWSTIPYIEFLPLGLVVLGASSTSIVRDIRVGNQMQGEVSNYSEGIPARYFERYEPLEKLQRLAKAGELGEALRDHQIIEFDTCEPGNIVSVVTAGKVDAVCFWGLTYDGRRPIRDVRLWWDEDVKQFRSEVVDLTLSGPKLRFGATTMTEAAGVELVKSFLTGYSQR